MSENAHQKNMHRYSLTDDVSASQATYLAVAEATNCDPLELPPIAQAIDADAVDDLFTNPRSTEDLLVTFEYADHLVTITPEDVRVETL